MKILLATLLIFISTVTFSQELLFNNPAMFGGCSFGNYFQKLYKTGQFDEMMKYTSSESIKKFGKDKILTFYKSMDFGYKIDLKSQIKDGNTIILNYESEKYATKMMMRMNVIVEKDTCRILLRDLKGI